MNILGIIPARMGSSRYPGKPMVKLFGKPISSLSKTFFSSSDMDKTQRESDIRKIFPFIFLANSSTLLLSPIESTKNQHFKSFSMK